MSWCIKRYRASDLSCNTVVKGLNIPEIICKKIGWSWYFMAMPYVYITSFLTAAPNAFILKQPIVSFTQ